MKLTKKVTIGYIRASLNILALVSKKKAARKAFDLFCTPMHRIKKKLPPLFEKGHALSFRQDGHMIRGHRWLPDDAGAEVRKRVLIIHGFESGSANFETYIGAFLKKGYEVLAFDAPAHGQSGGKHISLPLYANVIRSVCERFGPIQSFMAHSFGGLALASLLETYPHDRGTRVALIAPATEMRTAIEFFFRFLRLNQDIHIEFEEQIRKIGGFASDHYSIRRCMNHITASILWIHDNEDTITPVGDALRVREDHHENIQFVITNGLGHRKIYRDDEVFRQVVEFL
ncbi:MAG: alpha/beta fold hydrolase [Puia sp.]|nr:alpha/beta fold hydrolase [Puia sp.]